ncbi:MAG: T9SS type A sorting domain-containing protein [Flavobacteriales bacterium]|nr:T9SS type A sorting domain-containing protein [Flavobacteriales bacterium]
MKRILLFAFGLLPLVGVGQNWQSVSCGDLPSEFECYSSESMHSFTDTIDPIADTSLFWVDETGLWQYGHGYKPMFDSISPFQGWITDSVNSYPIGANAHLNISIGDFYGGWPGGNFILFQHKLDIQSDLEGAFIEISFDSLNWYKAEEVSCPTTRFYHYPINQTRTTMYDTGYMFSGTLPDWIWSGVQFIWGYPVFQGDENRSVEANGSHATAGNKLYMRFVFQSDDIESEQAGWMIRKIVVGRFDLYGSVSETDYLPLTIYPNPTTTTLRIQLPDNVRQATGICLYDMMGRQVHQQAYSPTIDIRLLARGTYVVVVATEQGKFRNVIQKE